MKRIDRGSGGRAAIRAGCDSPQRFKTWCSQAERLLKRCLEIQQRHSGDGNTLNIAATKSQLGGVCIAQAIPMAAETYLQASLADTTAALGAAHPDTGLARCRLASCRADMGQ